MSLDQGCYGGLDINPLPSAAPASAEGRVVRRGPVAAARFARLSAKIFKT